MKVNVNISKETLGWIMANINFDALSSQIAGRLMSWYSGEKVPTFNQIEEASRATGIPLGYFFLNTPPKEDRTLLEYRTVDSLELEKPSRNLLDTIHDMEQIQEWARNQMVTDGFSELEFVGSMADANEVATFVSQIRRVLDLPRDWFTSFKTPADSFRFLRSKISDAGVIVMMNGIVGNNTHRPLEINEFRAFAIADEYAPLIFINTNDSINGKLFSLLHEFAHILIGKNNFFNDRYSAHGRVNQIETICNAAAAEVLVPSDLFVEKWNEVFSENDTKTTISALAKYFKCGITVIARKALDHGYITSQEYTQISQLAVYLYNEQRKKAKENPGGDYYRNAASRIDQRFFRMLAGSVAEGKTLYSDAFRLTNTNRTTFRELIQQAGGGF
ncbi:MAG: ImmA/IrrE family metallo-endopeptidase [Oscillospiraceae bacterium]|nr:ImmA/IrrE family metallo-endopeptidase [Oscillospiraceae bacterium]